MKKKETQRQHWTSEEIKTAIAKALENEPDGANKDYWTSDLTVDAVKRKYHTTKFKPSPLKIVLVRQCCGEKFTHVLANKREAKGLDDWRCPGVECRLQHHGHAVRQVRGADPALGLRARAVVPRLVPRDRGRLRGGEGSDPDAGRHRDSSGGVPAEATATSAQQFTPTQQEVEWLMGKFTTQTIDKVCLKLFDGEE